jgi:hypothetical protein
MTDTGDHFGDEGAGPEEPPEVIADPENQAAAEAIRESTIGPADDPGPAPELAEDSAEEAPEAPEAG